MRPIIYAGSHTRRVPHLAPNTAAAVKQHMELRRFRKRWRNEIQKSQYILQTPIWLL